mmetsp:Transcript_21147/g.51029  ORF Transcript_21147/g.51029 Transcript_21147/m.51029 type:complete len:263 (+) Transcript_21147:763-1551(+)
MRPGEAGEVDVARADDVECLHGRVVDLLRGVRGGGGERGGPFRVIEGEGPFGEVVDSSSELRGQGGFCVVEPAKAREHPRVEDVRFGEVKFHERVITGGDGVGGDSVLAGGAAQLLDGGDGDGVGVGRGVPEVGVDRKGGVHTPENGIDTIDVMLQGATYPMWHVRVPRCLSGVISVEEGEVVPPPHPLQEAGTGEVELGEGGGGGVGETESSLVGVEVEAVLDPILGRIRVGDVERAWCEEGEVGEVGDEGGVQCASGISR